MGAYGFLQTVVICTLAVSLTGCGMSGEEPAPAALSAQEDEPVRLGVTFYSLRNEFTVRIVNAAQARANELGVELVVYDGNYDSGMQILQVEEMIRDGVDGIILNPQDVEECAPCVDLAAEAEVPIVGVNTKVNNAKLDSYVGSHDLTAGKLQMEKAAKLLGGQGEIVVLEGPLGQSAQVERQTGIHEVLEAYPDITVLSEKSGNWSRSEGMSVMKNWLEAFDGIDLVIAENDEMALGAADAAREAGENILVIGLDGSRDALTAVQSGELTATFFQDAEAQGAKAVDVLLDSIAGRPVEKDYWIEFEEVTAENVEQFLERMEQEACKYEESKNILLDHRNYRVDWTGFCGSGIRCRDGRIGTSYLCTGYKGNLSVVCDALCSAVCGKPSDAGTERGRNRRKQGKALVSQRFDNRCVFGNSGDIVSAGSFLYVYK